MKNYIVTITRETITTRIAEIKAQAFTPEDAKLTVLSMIDDKDFTERVCYSEVIAATEVT